VRVLALEVADESPEDSRCFKDGCERDRNCGIADGWWGPFCGGAVVARRARERPDRRGIWWREYWGATFAVGGLGGDGCGRGGGFGAACYRDGSADRHRSGPAGMARMVFGGWGSMSLFGGTAAAARIHCAELGPLDARPCCVVFDGGFGVHVRPVDGPGTVSETCRTGGCSGSWDGPVPVLELVLVDGCVSGGAGGGG